mgnify:CR=1 FL=1
MNDIISSRPEFQYVLQFTGEYDDHGRPKLQSVHKFAVFDKFCTPKVRTQQQSVDRSGYDDL